MCLGESAPMDAYMQKSLLFKCQQKCRQNILQARTKMRPLDFFFTTNINYNTST